jgi:hypothetical protein
MSKFLSFIDAICKDADPALTEAIKAGYSAIVESYADVIDHASEMGIDGKIAMFNRNAASYASSMGLGAQSFLERSMESRSGMWANEDAEPEMDDIPTSAFMSGHRMNYGKSAPNDNGSGFGRGLSAES